MLINRCLGLRVLYYVEQCFQQIIALKVATPHFGWGIIVYTKVHGGVGGGGGGGGGGEGVGLAWEIPRCPSIHCIKL